jgi:hypothetical protein
VRKIGTLELGLVIVVPDIQLDEDAKLEAIVSYDCLQLYEDIVVGVLIRFSRKLEHSRIG